MVKTSLNRRIQLAQESEEIDCDEIDEDDSNKKRSTLATTLHPSSVVRWLSLSDLLESIKKRFDIERLETPIQSRQILNK